MQRCMSESSGQLLNLLLPVATQMAGALHRVQPQGSYGALKTMNVLEFDFQNSFKALKVLEFSKLALKMLEFLNIDH